MREGEASTTARRVAAQRLTFRRVPAPYGRPEADQRLQADVAAGLESGETPLARYLQARTAFFDRAVIEAIDAGSVQMVAVGAGYDGRSLRYGRSGVRWFELDHPATHADKIRRLDRLGIDRRDVAFVSVDFAVFSADALDAAGFDRGQPAFFWCEGVAGYLPSPVFVDLLTALAEVATRGSRLAITLPLEPETADQRARRQRLADAVASVGEPMAMSIPRTRVAPLLAGVGWTVERATDPAGGRLDASTSTSAFVIAVR